MLLLRLPPIHACAASYAGILHTYILDLLSLSLELFFNIFFLSQQNLAVFKSDEDSSSVILKDAHNKRTIARRGRAEKKEEEEEKETIKN